MIAQKKAIEKTFRTVYKLKGLDDRKPLKNRYDHIWSTRYNFAPADIVSKIKKHKKHKKLYKK